METVEYCREIETYLCQKNDGHLIRVVGPSFELVSGWAARGIPLKVAFAGVARFSAASGAPLIGQEMAVMLAIAALAAVGLAIGLAGRESPR